MKENTLCSNDLINAIYDAMELLGAKSDLLGTIGSIGNTLSDEDCVTCLRSWIERRKGEDQ